MTPTLVPFAIDVIDKVPVSGKPWKGGSGNHKLLLHTIEAAHPWEIGWPRIWSRQTSAPHLYMNSDRFPDGDWLYQTLPLDVAAYAIRDNDVEDDRYMYQMEMAGRAAFTDGYPDSFYQAIAYVADWFVAEMGVEDIWKDFSCASAKKKSPCRGTKAEVDEFSGFMGHCHVGYGIDQHYDPGKLDTVRVQSFMKPEDDMATLEEFLEMVRPYDIDKMAADKIIRESERDYFLTNAFWVNPTDAFDSRKTNPGMLDWENLYKAWKVRSPIWAV